MIFRIALIALLVSSCAYHRAYKDRECNHSHKCCDIGCACCGRKVGLLDSKPIDNPRSASSYKETNYNAVVGRIGGDCGNSWLLHFKPSEGMESLSQPVYEINLPDSLKIQGLKIYIEYRVPVDIEFMKCTTKGPGYDQIFITSAIRVE